MTSPAEIQILYFAALRETAGKEGETIALPNSATAASVYALHPAAGAAALRRQPPIRRVGHRAESR